MQSKPLPALWRDNSGVDPDTNMSAEPEDSLPLESWASFQDAFGQPVTPDSLPKILRRFSWSLTVEALAGIAAHGAADQPGLRRLLVDELNAFYENETHPDRLRVLAYLNGPAKGRSIAHERSIHFLQEMAILHGDESVAEPRIGQVTLMALMANDYLSRSHAAHTLDALDEVFAAFCHLGLFNQDEERNSISRLQYLFGRSTPPLRHAVWLRVSWRDFLREALGMSFEDYYHGLVLPLLASSIAVWGQRAPDGKIFPPFIEQNLWIEKTIMPAERFTSFLNGVVIDRATARSRLVPFVDADGLPRASSLLFHNPFLRTRDTRVVVASPGAFREHLRTALWDHCRKAARRLFGENEGSQAWLATFGELFEDWVRHVATLAKSSPRKRAEATLIMPDVPGGPDEIEDVVLVQGDRVALVSVKAAMMPGHLPKEGIDSLGVIRWWERRLFARAAGKYRDGAARSLDTKVERLRRGEFEPLVPRGSTVYPLLVLYDELGGNPLAARWIERNCKKEGLLRRPGVRRLVPATIEDFELLMAVLADGGDVFGVLDETDHAQDPRLRSAVSRYLERWPVRPFEALGVETDDAFATMMTQLFGTERKKP